jgi:hypothetical protein
LFPLIDKLWDKFNDYLERQKAKKESDKKADEAKEKMDKAKDEKEVDDAAKDTLNNI